MKRKYPQPISPELLQGLLEIRAEERAFAKGHTLSRWVTAKRKWGRGARIATCVDCGVTAIILPRGDSRAEGRLAEDSPGIRGEALGKPCEHDIDPSQGMLGLRMM